MYKLVIRDDQGQTTVVPLLRDEVTIGRREGNTIRLTERNVSRSHARLVRRQGTFALEDLGSYNGILVNGERVSRSAELTSGDEVNIGDYAIRLQKDASSVAEPNRLVEAFSGQPPRLIAVDATASGLELLLTKPVMRIGRDEQLDIPIDHKSISHEHAEIRVVDGVVTLVDLDSANGIRVNGITATRVILETGDEIELGEVKLRFVAGEPVQSLEELPRQVVAVPRPSVPRKKPFFASALVALIGLAAVGAVWVTMRGTSPAGGDQAPRVGQTPESSPGGTGAAGSQAPSAPPIAQPEEWEAELASARQLLAEARIDQAFAVANRLPADSVLRGTPEFGEIRYRYVQAHLSKGQAAMRARESEVAVAEAELVLSIDGITPKQQRDARRLRARAERAQGSSRVATRAAAEFEAQGRPSPQEALAAAYECVAQGDDACVIQHLEGGQAISPASLALLIEAYRASGDFASARRQAAAFVRRFPNDPRAPRYRAMALSD